MFGINNISTNLTRITFLSAYVLVIYQVVLFCFVWGTRKVRINEIRKSYHLRPFSAKGFEIIPSSYRSPNDRFFRYLSTKKSLRPNTDRRLCRLCLPIWQTLETNYPMFFTNNMRDIDILVSRSAR